jgi:hypothetical protein
MSLDITPVDRAIARLEEGLSAYAADPANALIRDGNERGLLLGDWPRWRTWRSMRAKTSHTYDENIALEVVAGIPGFLDEARHLRDQLLSIDRSAALAEAFSESDLPWKVDIVDLATIDPSFRRSIERDSVLIQAA